MALEDSSLGRLIGVLVSPVKTFQSIAARPTWVAALLVLVVLGIPVVLSRATVQPVDALTGGLLASSPAFLLPEGSSVALKAVLACFDVFNLWTIVLYVIGYRIVARVSTGAAVTAAVVLFLLGMGIRVGFAAFLG